MKKEKGQISIEILLLAGIIIMLSVSIFGYYTRIMDPTIALETIEIETLKQIDGQDKQYFIKEIGYKAVNGCNPLDPLDAVCFCIMLDPADNVLNTNGITDIVASLTNYEAGTVSIAQNDATNCS